MTTPLVSRTTARRTVAYMSPDMFKVHARRGVSVESLVPGGSPADQTAALAGYIEEASTWMDSETSGTFVAGLDTYTQRVSVDRYGSVIIRPRYTPLIGLVALSVGNDPGSLEAMTDLRGICTEDTIQITAHHRPLTSSEGPLQFGWGANPWSELYVQPTVMHGFPHTTLTADVAAGASTMSLADVAGIIAGQTQLTVHAGAQRFRFVATSVTPSTGTPGMGSVGPGVVGCPAAPWAIPSLATSGYPVVVSAITADLILCTTLITRALIKGTAAGSVSAAAASAPGTPGGSKGPKNAGDDFATAWGILERYTAAWRA